MKRSYRHRKKSNYVFKLPFGEEIQSGTGGRTTAQGYGGQDNIRQKFTGYERDAETDLDYAKARMFGSSHGRFTSPDAVFINLERLQNPHLLNLYIYARNNPLKFVDPNGLWEWSAALGGKRTDAEIQAEIDELLGAKDCVTKEMRSQADALSNILQQRQNIRSGFELAQKVIDALKTNYGPTATALQAVKDQYGTENDGNDVVIGVRDAKSTSGVAFTKIENGKRIVAISEGEIFNSNTLFATLMHEGKHLEQAGAYLASGNNPSLWQSEYEAYAVAMVVAVAGQVASGTQAASARYSVSGTQIGQGDWTAQQSETAIKNHLVNLGLMQVNNQNQFVPTQRGANGAFPGGGVWH